MNRRSILVGLFAAALLVPAAFAQASLDKEPGYVNLSTMESWFGDEPFLFVNVKGALLNLVAEASRSEDEELSNLLHRLKAIQVRGFKNDGANRDDIRRKTSGFARELARDGWETVVRVRQDDEHVDLFLKSNGNNISGLMIMVVKDEDDETVFVNIVGDIDPEQVGRLGRKFNIRELEREW